MTAESPGRFKCALITGATSGIGQELARLLAEQQIDLILTGRSETELQALAMQLRHLVAVETLALDLTDPTARQKLVQLLHRRQPDLLVNNAGYGLYGESLEYSSKMHLNLLELNSAALMELTLEAVRTWRTLDRKGTVLNISSIVDTLPFPLFSTYAASKAFVTQFSRSFDAECQPYGIRILVACPGVVQTQFRQSAGGGNRTTTGGLGAPMTATFAAAQLWKQLQTQKQTYSFDWRYRWLKRLAFLIPTQWLARMNRKSIERFHPVGTLIPIPVDDPSVDHFTV